MKSAIIAATALLFAAPAIAQQPAEPTSAITAPVASGGPAAAQPKAMRYCVLSNQTGTRLTRKVCRTRDAWLARGYDPLTDMGK